MEIKLQKEVERKNGWKDVKSEDSKGNQRLYRIPINLENHSTFPYYTRNMIFA